MKKLMIYPYTNEVEELLQYPSLSSSQYTIHCIGFEDSHTPMLHHVMNNYNIYCTANLEEGCRLCDSVLLIENTMKFFHHSYMDIIKIAHRLKKDILLSKRLFNRLNLSSSTIGSYTIIDQVDFKTQSESERAYFDSIPTIVVMGMGENCSKFFVQLGIYSTLVRNDINVLSICSNPLGVIAGMYCIPAALYSEDFSLVKKVAFFSEWVRAIVYKNKPDIVLIGCPGGLLPLANYCHNYYGELALIISNSVVCDIGILCTYYLQDADLEVYEELKKLVKYRFGIEISQILTTNYIYRKNEGAKRIEYYHINDPISVTIDTTIKSGESISDITVMVNDLLSELEEGVEVL
ncbi:TIGR04066 family peptide maturation system protein [Suipraeoptans intestinalis]|uniref:TIGR04066 family peptide maturation system protein n=1 Tax=Suipraeoptans intestinalis TaxID=2606628 RepID=UPI002A758822|nr:TIGR04066 family peptide maturation system protein [Suipraeoptans intestinalis]MDY3122449.1 TIGR04066 family peptide maturation system protein [Suipraeoptans intestinalis]